MNKSGLYTTVTFLITFFFVGLGMVGMSKLVEYKESRILSEKGKLEIEEPARTWHEILETSLNENKASIKETEEMVEAFNNNENEISLEPGDGYIDEKTAIETAKVWIDSMEISRLFPEGGWLGECKASLVTKVSDNERVMQDAAIEGGMEENTANEEEKIINADPYYSYWLVEFFTSEADIKLYVNAGSNSVWNAKIILLGTVINNDDDIQEYFDIYGSDMLDEFASYTGVVMLEQEAEYFKKMGINAGTGNISETLTGDTGGYSITRLSYDSDIYAMMEIGIISDFNLKYEDYSFIGFIDEEYKNHIMVSYSLQL